MRVAKGRDYLTHPPEQLCEAAKQVRQHGSAASGEPTPASAGPLSPPGPTAESSGSPLAAAMHGMSVQPQPPPPPAGHQPVRIAGRPGRPGRGSRWGPFLLTYKAAGKGSWQATCPWRRGTEVNPRCKKTVPAQGEGDLTIRRLRQWCLLAARPDIITKTQHLKVELPGESPSHEELEDELAHLPPPPPWEDVLPEEALLLMLDVKASSSGSSSSSSGSSSSSTMSD